MMSLRGNVLFVITRKSVFTISALAIIVACGVVFSQTMRLPSKSMEQFLREVINKPEGELTSGDFKDLTELDASNQDITELDGIELCTNLTGLNLRYNHTHDIGHLRSLAKLKWINLQNNSIDSLEPLKDLKNLEHLTLSGNWLNDIYPLQDLNNLQELALDSNRISDLRPIAGLTKLKSLSLKYNNITDLTPLSDLQNLWELNLDSNVISNIEPLRNLKSLEILSLKNNYIRDPEPLSGLGKSLEVLYLDGNRIRDISTLRDLNKLNYLSLDENPIQNLEFSNTLEDITEISLVRAKVKDIGFIDDLPRLMSLNLAHNKIVDIEPILNHKFLLDINLHDNPLSEKARKEVIPAFRNKGKRVVLDMPREELENRCKLTLRALGSTELAYQDQNLAGNYGTWAALTNPDPKLRYIQEGYTRSNIIEFYSIVVFNVTSSSVRPDGRSNNDSTFSIVAFPYTASYPLRTFAIDNTQTPFVWIGHESEWSFTNINLRDPKLWEAMR